MARIMFLGGGLMQIPPIAYARSRGHYVITVDYLPDNPGHKYADYYANLSVTDRDGILKQARALGIDGIVAYASDIAAPTAAYVAESMGLPGNPYESVVTLTHKGKFRKFLADNGFNCPRAQYVAALDDAIGVAESMTLPLFVKPVDSAGSKGVTEVASLNAVPAAYENALAYSQCKQVIVEEKIVRHSYQVAGDGFVVNGKLAFRCFANEHFDKLVNGLVPIGESFPAIHDSRLLDHAHAEYQRLLTLLRMRQGALNFDYVFTKQGELYFLELGPRNGGNLIPDVTKLATGVDMIQRTVDAAIGQNDQPLELVPCDGYWASYILHSTRSGKLREIVFSGDVDERTVTKTVTAKPGDCVEPFIGSNYGLGAMILRFRSREEMLDMMDNMERHIDVRVD